jgi:hypothetical protein
MKPIFFDHSSEARDWLADYRKNHPTSKLQIRPLAYRAMIETGRRTQGGVVISRYPAFDYVGKCEIGYAGPPEYKNCYKDTINKL